MNAHSDIERSSRITINRFFGNLVLVIACCCVLSFLLFPALQNASSATGEIFPSSPEEYRRADTGLGVSIIRPQYWDVHDNVLIARTTAPDRYDFFYMRPYQYLARPEGATISVRRSIQKPAIDETTFTPRTFAGRPAWEGMLMASSNRFDSIPTFLIYVQDGSIWWTFAFSTTYKMPQLPDGPRAFLESVRFDSDATKSG